MNYTVRAYVNYDDFVVYTVSSTARQIYSTWNSHNLVFWFLKDEFAANYNASVYSPEGTISVDDTTRYITVISSYDATQFDQFNGSFPVRFL